MQYHQKHSGLAFFDEVVNEDEFLEFLIEWSDSIVPPENMVLLRNVWSTSVSPSCSYLVDTITESSSMSIAIGIPLNFWEKLYNIVPKLHSLFLKSFLGTQQCCCHLA